MAPLKLKPGVITGDALLELFAYCKKAECALPAVNVIGSNSANAALAAARAAKLLPWVDGVIAAGEDYFARNGEPLFSSHMLDLSEEPLAKNLEVSRKYLSRIARMKMTLEIELGVTGGEEDGVDNSGVEHDKLYTSPDDVLQAYDVLSPVGSFTVAASFGNTHGVYAAGNVKLKPPILHDSQVAVQRARKTGDKPLNFVFHGGSGSTPAEIREAVSYGVVKM